MKWYGWAFIGALLGGIALDILWVWREKRKAEKRREKEYEEGQLGV